MRRILITAFSIWLIIAGALAFPAGTPISAATPEFKEAPCEGLVFIPDDFDAWRLRCGSITVEENRNRRDSRLLEITAAVIKARSGESKPDPVVFLVGGPGQAGVNGIIGSAEWYSEALESRDYVVFDFRGTGLSGKLACEEEEAAEEPITEEPTAGDEEAAFADPADLCHERYVADGVDLTQYDSATIVEDMVEVMNALGYDEWNLIGGSYGTRLALTAMRDAGKHIRSVVLDAPAPPVINVDIERARLFEPKLEELWSACAAEPKCRAAYPDIEQTFWDLIARANASPIVVQMTAPDGTPVDLEIDGNTLINYTFTAMSDTALLPLIPFATDEIARGNTGVLSAVAAQLLFVDYGIATGMFWSVQCNEEWPFYTAADVQRATTAVRPEIIEAGIGGFTVGAAVDGIHSFCEEWNDPDPAPIEAEAVSSSIPTLILAGEFDTNTPTEFGEVAARTLRNSYLIEVPSSGHFVSYSQQRCTNPMIASFIDQPGERPDETCIKAIPPIDFVVAAEPPDEAPPQQPPPNVPAGVMTAPDTGMGRPRNAAHTWGYAMWMAGTGALLIAAGVRRRAMH